MRGAIDIPIAASSPATLRKDCQELEKIKILAAFQVLDICRLCCAKLSQAFVSRDLIWKGSPDFGFVLLVPGLQR